jgi:hypothetical protein
MSEVTSLENWLKDENLDRAAGIKPTHPGHTVHTNPRWSGVGKGDTSRVRDKAAFDRKKESIFGTKPARPDVFRQERTKSGWVLHVSTPGGNKKMTELEYQAYSDGLS